MAVTTQPSCARAMDTAYAMQVPRRLGHCRAARNHWVSMATRMTTYPRTTTRLREGKAPDARENVTRRDLVGHLIARIGEGDDEGEVEEQFQRRGDSVPLVGVAAIHRAQSVREATRGEGHGLPQGG